MFHKKTLADFLSLSQTLNPRKVPPANPAGKAKHVLLDKGRSDAFDAAAEIIALCSAAGKHHLASGFIQARKTGDQVRFELEHGSPKPWGEIMNGKRRLAA